MFVHLLAVSLGARLPVQHGALVQVEGRHDGWHRAAEGQQRNHLGHQIGGRPQAVEHGAVAGGKVWSHTWQM